MSYAYDLTVASVITIIAAIVHFMSVELFAPGSTLWGVATDGTAVLNGTARAAFWFEILAVWVPMGAIVGIWLWVMVRIYKRQAITGVQRARRPR